MVQPSQASRLVLLGLLLVSSCSAAPFALESQSLADQKMADAQLQKVAADEEMAKAQRLMKLAQSMRAQAQAAVDPANALADQAAEDLRQADAEKAWAEQKLSGVRAATSRAEELEAKRVEEEKQARLFATKAEDIASTYQQAKDKVDAEAAEAKQLMAQAAKAKDEGDKQMAAAQHLKETSIAEAEAAQQERAALQKELKLAQADRDQALEMKSRETEVMNSAKEAEAAAEKKAEKEIAGNHWFTVLLYICSAVGWIGVAGLCWLRWANQEMHNHNLAMIVHLNEDRLKQHERLQQCGLINDEEKLLGDVPVSPTVADSLQAPLLQGHKETLLAA